MTRKKVYEALMKRAKITFFFGVTIFGASLSWLIANIARIVYGTIPVHEALVPLTLLIVGLILMITYANIGFLSNDSWAAHDQREKPMYYARSTSWRALATATLE